MRRGSQPSTLRRWRWLARAAAAGGFQFAHHLIDAEASGLLSWRKVLEALDPLRDEELRRHEQEDPTNLPVSVIVGFVLSLFEWVAAQVEEQWHPKFHERLRPDLKTVLALLGEH